MDQPAGWRSRRQRFGPGPGAQPVFRRHAGCRQQPGVAAGASGPVRSGRNAGCPFSGTGWPDERHARRRQSRSDQRRGRDQHFRGRHRQDQSGHRAGPGRQWRRSAGFAGSTGSTGGESCPESAGQYLGAVGRYLDRVRRQRPDPGAGLRDQRAGNGPVRVRSAPAGCSGRENRRRPHGFPARRRSGRPAVFPDPGLGSRPEQVGAHGGWPGRRLQRPAQTGDGSGRRLGWRLFRHRHPESGEQRR